MATVIKSKHATVSRAPYMLYMGFVDMRNFVQFLPEEKRGEVTADYDSIKAVVQGFNIGVRIVERVPYSRIEFKDDGAPFSFTITMHFDAAGGDPDKTDFHIELSAELNMMMKMMLGSKLQEGLDKIVDALAAVSEGKIPEGVDPELLRKAQESGKFN
ncbi:MAG: hypothetical protein IAC23_06145 [Bacteroidetes bacterium]|uniref:Polyketide cyclase n=1 Tax=Candidatus Cryptobacteroides merdavium TaxID=2840769 RepID=A0A9D9EEX7_9BACT|nr:hypothetical protein [Candidatus Cryptobacteroides merdavium]